jgi:FkbM family methyltransferase
MPKAGLQRLYRSYASRQSGRRVVARVEGVTYDLDLDEMIDSALYFEGSWEIETRDTLASILRPGMVALDVGANMGYYTLLFARLLGDNGLVVAFEPTAWACAKLLRNIELNGFTNIKVEKLALSDKSGTRQVAPDERAFRASWAFSGAPARSATESVAFQTLDSYMHATDMATVDFIKIDVDGYEYRVVNGALETIRAHRPVVLIEIGGETMGQLGDSRQDLVALLDQLGYAFFTPDRQRRFSGVAELLGWLPYPGANVLCIPRE